jgi:hypothetical protein
MQGKPEADNAPRIFDPFNLKYYTTIGEEGEPSTVATGGRQINARSAAMVLLLWAANVGGGITFFALWHWCGLLAAFIGAPFGASLSALIASTFINSSE